MDPLSVSASVVGLLGAGAKITSCLWTFATNARDAPQLARHLVFEVADITAALGSLQAYVCGQAQAPGCVTTFSDLQSLMDQLNLSPDMGTIDKMKWARQESNITAIVQRLQNHKSSLTLMLTVLQCETMKEAQSSTRHLCTLVEELLQSNQDLASRIRGLEREGSIIAESRRDDVSTLRQTYSDSDVSLRSPHLSFLWLGAIISGLHKGFLRGPGGLLGLNRIDIHEAAWTGTLISFIQDHVPQQPENTTSISRRNEFTLAFLTQGVARYRYPTIFPHAPLGSTAVEELDLDVRLHMACPGGHALKFSKITWPCAGGKKEVYEAAALTTIARPLSRSSRPVAARLVDYSGLDPDRDISERVTRNIFTWMREVDGFPVSERKIYKHEWLDDGDSDGDDRNCAEGDGGSTIGCDLSVTVGGWISGVVAARCNSL